MSGHYGLQKSFKIFATYNTTSLRSGPYLPKRSIMQTGTSFCVSVWQKAGRSWQRHSAHQLPVLTATRNRRRNTFNSNLLTGHTPIQCERADNVPPSVILDASARRFQAQGIYLRATAAMRWINSRNAILDGARPSAAHQSRLNAVQQTLNNVGLANASEVRYLNDYIDIGRQELAGITDDRILSNLRTTDQQSGKWIGEDPSLNQIRQWIASRR